MNATKKLAISLVLFIVASAFSITTLAKAKQAANIKNSGSAALVLYYGNGCPHCKIVEDYIKKNHLDKTLDLAQKEIWQNKDNQKEMFQAAQNCGLNLEALGVPMLYDRKENKCYGGQPDKGSDDIINFLKSQN